MAEACEAAESSTGCPQGIPWLDTVRCCDCLDGFKDVPDACIDLIVTDPPYSFSATQGGGAFGSSNRAYHGELEPISHGFRREVNEQMLRAMKSPNVYIWCSKDQLRETMDWWLDNADVTMDLLTWHKTNPTPMCSNKYLSDTEYLLFFRGKGVKVYGEYATKRKWYATPTNKADKEMFGHPTVKPLEITRNIVANSSQGGDVVLDPFAGTGTTAVGIEAAGPSLHRVREGPRVRRDGQQEAGRHAPRRGRARFTLKGRAHEETLSDTHGSARRQEWRS